MVGPGLSFALPRELPVFIRGIFTAFKNIFIIHVHGNVCVMSTTPVFRQV